MALVEAIVLLERQGVDFSLYEPALENETDWEAALLKTFLRIREKVILISFSSENHFIAVGSLIFLSKHIDLLQGKEVHVCLPALGLFEKLPFERAHVIFHKRLLNELVRELFFSPEEYQEKYVQEMVAVMNRYGYSGRIVSGALNPDCRYHCAFCFSRESAGGRGPNSPRRMDRIMQLMDVAEISEAKFFKFTDPNFIHDTTGVAGFIDHYRVKSYRTPWHCSARLDLLNKNKEIYEQMVSNGCEYILMGVEHAVSRIGSSLNKGEDSRHELAEFLKHWDRKTILSLSFMTGFKNESTDDSLLNLDFIKRLRKIKGIRAYLGYYMLFRQEKIQDSETNYLIGLIYLLRMVPSGKTLSLKYARSLLSHCIANPFFSFYYLTVNGESLKIIQGIMQTFEEDQDLKDCMPEMKRFLQEAPEWIKPVQDASSLRELNNVLLYG